MVPRAAFVALQFALLAFAPAAFAGGGGPPDDDQSDTNHHHVHSLKPWKAKFEYRVVRDADVHGELNGRSDVEAGLVQGQWMKINCQLYNETQNGTVLWNHIPRVGWIPDEAMKTYTDGRLEGSPTCAEPHPNHVWFKQPWAPAKEYRLKRNAQAYDRPSGLPIAKTFAKDSWTTTSCHQRRGKRQWVRIEFTGRRGYIRADALGFWQKGVPAGTPLCEQPQPTPIRTWNVMGDSYASGQGANNYFDEDCRRSNNSYWALLRTHVKRNITSPQSDFTACTGATTDQVLEHQLSHLDTTTRLITLSVGGDNLHFATVMKKCVWPTGVTCTESIKDNINGKTLRALRKDLGELYRAIHKRAPQATVLVLGYPQLVDPDQIDGCGAMDDDDGPALHLAGERLNRAIKRAVGNRDRFRFISLVKTFRNHPACKDGSDDWINSVVQSDHDESFHPNEQGHRAIAGKLRHAAPKWFD